MVLGVPFCVISISRVGVIVSSLVRANASSMPEVLMVRVVCFSCKNFIPEESKISGVVTLV